MAVAVLILAWGGTVFCTVLRRLPVNLFRPFHPGQEIYIFAKNGTEIRLSVMTFWIVPVFPGALGSPWDVYLALLRLRCSRSRADYVTLSRSASSSVTWRGILMAGTERRNGLHLGSNCLANGIIRSAANWSRKCRSGGKDLQRIPAMHQ